MRFVHAADIHLDSPLRGLEDYPGAPAERIRGATRAALVKLIDLCLVEAVDFLLIAGDLFDNDWQDFHTPLFVANQLQRLQAKAIPAFVILGNHDSFTGMSRRTPWPSNVHLFDHRQPQTIRLESLHVALHGMSFATREVRDNLVPHYPAPVANWFNIGLLHTNANGSPNHDSYAPCNVAELVAKGYDYWALGHVHDFQVLHERPPVIYSGNPQGRHVREIGAKGAVLVSVTNGAVTGWEFRETDVLRWFHEIVTLAETDGLDELRERVRDRLRIVQAHAAGRFAAVRLEIDGRCDAHRLLAHDGERQAVVNDLRSIAGDFGGELWIEKIKFKTRSPLNVEALREGPDLIGELLRSITATTNDPQQLAELGKLLQPLATKVAVEVKDAAGGEALDFTAPEQLAEWVRDAERILLDRLVESAE